MKSAQRESGYRVASHTGVGRRKKTPNEWLIESEQSLVDGGDVLAVMPGAEYPATRNCDTFRRYYTYAVGEFLHKAHLNAGTYIGVARIPRAKHYLPE